MDDQVAGAERRQPDSVEQIEAPGAERAADATLRRAQAGSSFAAWAAIDRRSRAAAVRLPLRS